MDVESEGSSLEGRSVWGRVHWSTYDTGTGLYEKEKVETTSQRRQLSVHLLSVTVTYLTSSTRS